jgi:molybdopterin-containing oxidoreductase family iron-sulfur binding subunit
MKTLPVLQEPGPTQRLSGPAGRRSLWQAVEELEGRRGARAGEFAAGAAEVPPELSRRSFLQILGASAALAGATACQPPREKIVPYVKDPPEDRPGKRFHYATALALDGYATGLVVAAADGRPVKVEGNPAHPTNQGASSAFDQAALLDLYDPDRAKGIWHGKQPLSWRGFLAEAQRLARGHEADGGARLWFLLAPDASPLLADLRRRLRARFPRARLLAWAPVGADHAAEGARIAFGQPLDTHLRLDAARVILSLDADLLAGPGESLRWTREFARHRVPEGELSRLYVAEAALTNTGAAADHRFRMRPSEVAAFARAVAGHLGVLPAGEPLGDPARERAAKAVAADLARHRGRSLVAVGERQPAAVHALGHAMNAALGNVGATVVHTRPVLGDAAPSAAALAELARAVQAGQVDTLVVTAWNPAYAAPAALGLGALLEKVPNAIYHAIREDETSRRCSWRVAAAHPFETWGDARARDGSVTLVQPLVAPLYESVPAVDLLAAFLDQGDRGAHAHLQAYWKARSGLDGAAFQARWNAWLTQGLVPGTAEPAVTPALDAAAVAAAARGASPRGEGMELALAPSSTVWDGRFATNAWLQELPDPITKVTWDNPAYLSEATARRLGLADGQVATLALGGRSVQAAVKVMPGHADECVTLALGQGRTAGGGASRGVGTDAYALRPSADAWFAPGLSVAPGKGKHRFAITQGHFSTEGRPLAFDFDAKEWASGHGAKELDEHRGEVPAAQKPVDYSKEEHKWGMSVDLSRCTGCNACVIACQEENNVPVVGAEQVSKGRHMAWIRVDRYFAGPASDPQALTQPVMCQHCETAPCEYVCPVNATVHSPEGLNEMVYNRCVGTRYCSNNCPYKVRRFNFLDFRGDVPAVQTQLFNPDVTVRSRGVMEKCTYCVQRIERARIDVRAGGQKRIEGVQSACQQACPAEAIVFGNLNDEGSKVARLQRDARRYDLLHDIGTRPRTTYLARIRNPNPDLA